MSNLMQIIKSRRSTRAFKSELPPKDQIMQMVEAAEWAPSGMGKYLWHFTVVYNAEKSLRLAKAVAEADNRGPDYNFYGAPVNIIISYKRDEHHAFVDGAAAMGEPAPDGDRARPWHLLDQPDPRVLRRSQGSRDPH